MRVKFTLIVLVVMLGALAGYGCGGSGDDSGGSGDTTAAKSSNDSGDGTTAADGGGEGDGNSEPLAKPQFIRQADAICAKVPQRYNAGIQRVTQERNGTAPSIAEGNRLAAIPPLPEAVEELEGLTPPAGDEAKFEAMIAALEDAQKGMEEEPASELSGPESPFAPFQKLTEEYGLRVCSQL